jgi:hypothetical protein
MNPGAELREHQVGLTTHERVGLTVHDHGEILADGRLDEHARGVARFGDSKRGRDENAKEEHAGE